jgi:uncharacterized membrane-anchored protein
MQKCVAMFFVVLTGSVHLAAGQEAPPSGWTVGPVEGKLGSTARVSVPEGYFFLDKDATRRFLEQNENIPDGDELGTIVRVGAEDEADWFAVFSYSDTGHIDDSEKNEIDAAALMKQMQAGNKRGNEERLKRGWTALNLEGWQQPPFYDPSTNHLTWATRLSSEGQPVVNHSVRLLGRTGLMSAQLVADPAVIERSTVEFNEVLRGYAFNEGLRYAEFRPGDKLAGYGLTALIAGGAGAAAVKSGLLQKVWKLLVLGFIALVGGIKKFFNFGKSPELSGPAPAAPASALPPSPDRF